MVRKSVQSVSQLSLVVTSLLIKTEGRCPLTSRPMNNPDLSSQWSCPPETEDAEQQGCSQWPFPHGFWQGMLPGVQSFEQIDQILQDTKCPSSRKTNIINVSQYPFQKCENPIQHSYLNRCVESDAEVPKYLETLIQLHSFFVFTEKVNESISLLLQFSFLVFKLLQMPYSKLQQKPYTHEPDRKIKATTGHSYIRNL